MKIAVLVSGNGSNLQAIIDAISNNTLTNITIAQVIADRNCHAIERALENDIETYLVEDQTKTSEEINEFLNKEIELIVLAGFLSILNNEFCTKWQNKLINIHPSLLPKYGGKGMYGKHVHQAVLQNNEKESGATIHYVIPEIDKGEIILQKNVEISQNETIETLSQKIHQLEHQILIEALHKLSS